MRKRSSLSLQNIVYELLLCACLCTVWNHNGVAASKTPTAYKNVFVVFSVSDRVIETAADKQLLFNGEFGDFIELRYYPEAIQRDELHFSALYHSFNSSKTHTVTSFGKDIFSAEQTGYNYNQYGHGVIKVNDDAKLLWEQSNIAFIKEYTATGAFYGALIGEYFLAKAAVYGIKNFSIRFLPGITPYFKNILERVEAITGKRRFLNAHNIFELIFAIEIHVHAHEKIEKTINKGLDQAFFGDDLMRYDFLNRLLNHEIPNFLEKNQRICTAAFDSTPVRAAITRHLEPSEEGDVDAFQEFVEEMTLSKEEHARRIKAVRCGGKQHVEYGVIDMNKKDLIWAKEAFDEFFKIVPIRKK